MFAPSKIKVGARAVALALALATSSFSAHAVLERAGPVSTDPSVGGFPAWYQDTTGIALEFCAPQNASEVEGSWCLLLPTDIPLAPEVFPTNFFDEHFYFAGNASIDTRVGGKALLVLAQEAAFMTAVTPGDQTVFSRIRVVMTNVPATGTYRVIHPYGEESIQADAGGKIFFTEDIGIECGLNFNCASKSRLGPFLMASATPGGNQMPALTAANQTPDTDPNHFGGAFVQTPYPGTGAAYIADPSRIGPVTGSTLPDFTDSTGALRNHNIFRIEGPVGSGIGVDALGNPIDWIETTDFALMGRLHTGALAGRMTVERASYTRDAAGQKLDVFANAVPTTQARLPGAPQPAAVTSTLTFFDAPCDGTVDAFGTIRPPFRAPLGAIETPMKAASALQWAQTQPVVMPSTVCVKDASARNAAGQLVPVYVPHVVTDEVTVTPAFYDPAVGTLTVGAASSDTALPPSLNLAYESFLGDLLPQGGLAAGQIVVPGMLAPPSSVFVQSSALGITKYQTSTGFVAAPPAALPVAANDAYTFPMNSAPQTLNILANDSNVAGGTVALTSLPTFGTAVVNLDGTVTYTPNLNASGNDAFTYTVTVGTQTSNAGIASLAITSVNLAPTAVNDTANAVINIPLAINVIANDTDPNGAADVRAAVNVSQPTPAGATVSVAGGIVTFNAIATGTYSFTYNAQDAAGLVSANAGTVTVQVALAESISFAKSQYVVSKSRLVVSGPIDPISGQTITLEFVDAAGVVLGSAGTVTSDALGGWALDVVGIALPAGAVSIKATSSNGTVQATGIQLK
jgi:hypothetical protein